MDLNKIQKEYQITLPKSVSVIPKDQRYFHTREW